MAKRKYSVEEIDTMRGFVTHLFPWGVSYRPEVRAREVEERLRTHMLNGTTPGELEAAAREHFEREHQRQQEYQRAMTQFREAEESA